MKTNRPEEICGKGNSCNEGEECAWVKDWGAAVAHAGAEGTMEAIRVGATRRFEDGEGGGGGEEGGHVHVQHGNSSGMRLRSMKPRVEDQRIKNQGWRIKDWQSSMRIRAKGSCKVLQGWQQLGGD